MKRKGRMIIFICMAMAVLFGCTKKEAYLSCTVEEDKKDEASTGEIVETAGNPDEIYVYVCGYVNHPGVYSLDKDARICDALFMAGGVTDEGAGESLNQAEHMTDGQTIYVPGIQEVAKATEESAEDGILNINTAGKEELLTLPGIGESKADTILAYRNEHGDFEKIEDLMNIPGIKKGVFEKIKPYIKV